MISPIITYGFGSYGSVSLVPTYGFHIAVDTSLLPPVIDIEVNSSISRSHNLSSLIDSTLSFRANIVRSIEFRGDL